MNKSVLIVDDDANLLQALHRQLVRELDVTCAVGAHEALYLIKHSQFAVVLSDMQMPGMDGVQFLAQVRELSPDSTRMLFTGHATLQVALDAVNEGHIFRFLVKPCPAQILAKAIAAGIEQYRLNTLERELLSKTLRGGIKVLTDVLALTKPTAFGRATRVQRLVAKLAAELKVEPAWQAEIAAMLSQVGCVAVPEDTLNKVFRNQKLSPEEIELYDSHASIGSGLIANIPRLEDVARIIAYQDKHYDGSGLPVDEVQGDEIPLGARILKVALDFDALTSLRRSDKVALAEILGRRGWYDPRVVGALKRVLALEVNQAIQCISLADLPDQAILAEDVRTLAGRLLIARGQEVTPTLRARLKLHATIVGVREPLRVLVPIEDIQLDESCLPATVSADD